MSTEPDSLDPLAAWQALAADADRHIAARLGSLPRGGAEVSCTVGCSACCRQLVVVSPLEAHAIAAYVAERPELAAAVAERAQANTARIAADPDLARRLAEFRAAAGHVEGTVGGALEVRYWAAQIPCVFLDGDRCAIYPVRPFACREHFVTSPPELCRLDPDRTAPTDTRLEYRTLANFLGAVLFGIPERQIAVGDALAYAESRAGERRRRVPRARFLAVCEAAKRRLRRALALLHRQGRR